MKTITFNCEIITPMFLSGADDNTPELRPPSIKGMIRFWWRAIHPDLPLDKLKKQEAEIFGGSDEKEGKNNDKKIGKSKVIIRVKNGNIIKGDKKVFPSYFKAEKKVSILDYLAYGPRSWDKEQKKIVFTSDYLEIRSTFDIVLKYKEEYEKSILMAFYFFSTFGSLGSKSRNGFGNFIVKNQDLFKPLGEAYTGNPTENITKILGKHKNYDKLPSYTTFSNNMELFRLKENFSHWHLALAEIGEIYRQAKLSLEPRHQHKERQYIGAPINNSILERRAKPYFIRILRDNNNKYHSYILYLPSKYCEGIDKDINHNEINRNFEETCKQFNKNLIDVLNKELEKIKIQGDPK